MRVAPPNDALAILAGDASGAGASAQGAARGPSWSRPAVEVSVGQVRTNDYFDAIVDKLRPWSQRKELTEAEKRKVEQLRKKDAEIRAHEAQHLATGGPYIRGGVSLVLERGPDGRMYAIDGSVDIDTKLISQNPAATLRKARTIRAAALAPACPSSADRHVAAVAASMEAWAKAQLQAEAREAQAEYWSSKNAVIESIGGGPTPPPGARKVDNDHIYRLQAIFQELATYHY